MADCTGLENRHVREGIVSSNLTLSAFLNPFFSANTNDFPVDVVGGFLNVDRDVGKKHRIRK